MDTEGVTDDKGLMDVEAIMGRIRENVNRKIDSGVYSEADIKDVSGAALDEPGMERDVLSAQLNLLKKDYDLASVPRATSHRSAFKGWLIVTIKRITLFVLTRFGGAMWEKQAGFNYGVLGALEILSEEIKRMNDENAALRKKLDGLEDKKTHGAGG